MRISFRETDAVGDATKPARLVCTSRPSKALVCSLACQTTAGALRRRGRQQCFAFWRRAPARTGRDRPMYVPVTHLARGSDVSLGRRNRLRFVDPGTRSPRRSRVRLASSPI